MNAKQLADALDRNARAVQFRSALERLEISQRGFAKWIGVDERTVRRWISGDDIVPRAVWLLLRVMLRYAIKPEDIK